MNRDPHDPLLHADGAPATLDTWAARRQELHDAIVTSEYGGLPQGDTETRALLRSANRLRDGVGGVPARFMSWEVRVEVGSGELSFPLYLWLPADAESEPRPVVLCGDGCWRTFDDEVVRRVLERGYGAAVFDRTAMAADNKDLYRHTGLYRLLPDLSFGALSAWAWGYHRCVDVLEEMDGVRGDAIAITGHSRGGKAVLLAGATDERIGLVNPNDSGTGGAAPNHRKAPGAEVVADFFRSGNIFWFGQDFADHKERDGELPYEQHYLHALVAPRPLLVTEGYDDHGANPPGAYALCQAARPVFQLLGAPEAIGWALREGGHGHRMEDFESLLDYMARHFEGRQVRRDFQRPLFPDLEALLVPPGTAAADGAPD